MSVILCPHCGTSNRAGSNFCNACGTDLRSGDEPRPQPTDAPTSPAPDDHPTEEPTAPGYGAETRDSEPQEGEVGSRGAREGEISTPASSPSRESEETEAAVSPDEPPDYDPQLDDQPWLDYGFDEEDSEAEAAGDPGDLTGGSRLITGIQGLLDPIRISRKLDESGSISRPAPLITTGEDAETLRRMRALLYEEPRLAGRRRRAPSVPARARLFIPWLFLMTALIIALPIALGLGETGQSPPEWPGVAEAHAVIQNLPPDAVVLIYWAYDPATAGELDLAARPVIRHLLERQARLVGVSSLPTGPATARRLVEEVRQSRTQAGIFTAAGRNPWPVTVTYLPGGASVLPLLAAAPALALGFDPTAPDATTQGLFDRPPALAVVFGAQAEDVQHWLEQVQPRNRVPVVAVVSAGADPMLRPFLDSGQLRGLVSGYDGAYHYRTRLDPQESRSDGERIRLHIGAQNWAHLAIIAALILGNLGAVSAQTGRE